jgi:hypothetical protein
MATHMSVLSGTGDVHAFECDFLTDVEGDLVYFNRWVDQSTIVHRGPDGVLELTHPGAHFVYGGDAIDRGEGSVRLLRSLVQLKRAFPERVTLLVGNRDLNKLRLTSELGPADMARHPSQIPPPHWDNSAPSLLTYLEELAASSGARVEDLDCRAERLRYMYRHTLGCPSTFEHWRAELSLLRGCNPTDVSDDDVVAEVMADVRPGGALHEYLSLACVAALKGNTLFVHGAVDPLTLGFVPDDSTRFCLPTEPPPFKRVECVAEWVEEMNAFLRRGLAAHAAQPEWDDARHRRGGEQLMALQNRCAVWGRSVVSNCFAGALSTIAS